MDIIGLRYVGWNGEIYLCESYNPRQGFWMQNVDNSEDRRCISERAIDRTFHRVRMTYGAWNHLALYEKLGCTPTMHDLGTMTRVIPEMTHKTLQQNRLTDVWGNLTDRGRAALAVPENEREQYWDTLRG